MVNAKFTIYSVEPKPKRKIRGCKLKMCHENYAETLVKLRGKKTQGEVAEAIGVTKQALSAYENGRRMPRDKVKIAIAEYYGVPVQHIFFNEK